MGRKMRLHTARPQEAGGLPGKGLDVESGLWTEETSEGCGLHSKKEEGRC